MRKLFTILVIGSLLAACSDTGQSVKSTEDSTSKTTVSRDSATLENDNNGAMPDNMNAEEDTALKIGEDSAAIMQRKPYQKP